VVLPEIAVEQICRELVVHVPKGFYTAAGQNVAFPERGASTIGANGSCRYSKQTALGALFVASRRSSALTGLAGQMTLAQGILQGSDEPWR
jgi:hypothetical protein